MQIQIVMRDIPSSSTVETLIRKKAERLNQFCKQINNCKIAVELPQKSHRQGNVYNVRIDLTVPGKELAVSRSLNQNLGVAIRDAFKAITRQCENYLEKRRGDVKSHNTAKLILQHI